MAASTYAKNVMLDAVVRGQAPASSATHLSLHTGDPGVTGASEITGGSPAYARRTITWNAASGGSIDDNVVGSAFDIPAGTTVTHWGTWDALSGGNFIIGGALSVPEPFGAQGTYTPTDLDISM